MNEIGNKGFTLLELMLSLTMLAIMVVIVFGTFRVGVRAWEKGERDVEDRHRQRIVLEQMRRQLTSMSTRELVEDGKQPFYPIGSAARLQFISELPMLHENGFGLVYVEYRIEPGEDETVNLMLFERNLVLLEASFFEGEPDPEQFVELIPGLQAFSFEFMSRGQENDSGEWREEWNPADEQAFPRAVRLSMTDRSETQPITVIAAVEWE